MTISECFFKVLELYIICCYIVLIYNYSILIVYFRVESVYRVLKLYLGSKKTQSNLFTTWINIENAIINQTCCITVEDSSKRDYVPLELNYELFCGVFGVVI